MCRANACCICLHRCSSSVWVATSIKVGAVELECKWPWCFFFLPSYTSFTSLFISVTLPSLHSPAWIPYLRSLFNGAGNSKLLYNIVFFRTAFVGNYKLPQVTPSMFHFFVLPEALILSLLLCYFFFEFSIVLSPPLFSLYCSYPFSFVELDVLVGDTYNLSNSLSFHLHSHLSPVLSEFHNPLVFLVLPVFS